MIFGAATCLTNQVGKIIPADLQQVMNELVLSLKLDNRKALVVLIAWYSQHEGNNISMDMAIFNSFTLEDENLPAKLTGKLPTIIQQKFLSKQKGKSSSIDGFLSYRCGELDFILQIDGDLSKEEKFEFLLRFREKMEEIMSS